MDFGYGATYHVCPKRKWFASFEKLDESLVSFDNGRICYMEEIDTARIKLSDGMVRKLKDVRYIPQLKNVNSIGALEAQNVLKMFSDSLVVLKGIRHNLCYFKGSAITKKLTASEHLNVNSIRL